MYLLGSDVGTSVIKATLFDVDGQEIGSAARESPVLHSRLLWAEQDMGKVWKDVSATIREVVEATNVPPEQIAAIGLTGQGDGTWLIDGEGLPVRPAITWLDGRAADYLGQFQRQGIDKEIFAITGTALNTCNQGLQMHWLQDHEPAALQHAAAALRAKDWAFLRLTGVVSTDETDASFTYFDIRRRAYDDRVLDLLGISRWRHLIPEARPSYRNIGKLLPAVAAQLGLKAGMPVVSGPLDVIASALGLGVIAPGDACTILGTAGIHESVLDAPSETPVGVGYNICHALPDRWVRLLPTMTGTLNLQWFAKEFYAAEVRAFGQDRGKLWDYLETLARQVGPGAEGVIYHPYIDPAGERAPFIEPLARGQFVGLSLHHRREVLLRAVYEGVVLSAMDCYRLLAPRMASIKLGGGGSRSDFWTQMFADVMQCPVQVMQGREFGAKGAAINAGVAIGLYPTFADAVARTVRPARQFLPDAEAGRIYAALYEVYRDVYGAMFPLWDRLAQLRRSL
jgi:erythritol kinase